MHKSKLVLLTFRSLGLGAALLAGPAFAGSELFDPLSTCTTENCQSQVVNGNVFGSDLPRPDSHKPWVAQIFKGGGPDECLRIDMITQSADLVAILTCPDFPPITWLSNDRPGPRGLALLIAGETIPDGWCTLTISGFDGGIRPPEERFRDAQFRLRFGRYSPANQLNCLPATRALRPPASAASQEKAQ